MLQNRQTPKLSEVIIVFVGLAMVYVVLTVIAQWLFASNTLVYTILMSLGAAIFGAGLAFFLIEASEIERKRLVLASRVSVFVGLAIVFAVLVLIAQFLFATNPPVHTTLVSIGAATFAGGLTYFLVEMFSRR